MALETSDCVVAGEAPHGRDLLSPGIKSMAERDQWGEPATTQRGHIAEEAARQLLAAFVIAAFLEQQIGEPLLEAVDRLQRRVFSEVSREALVLLKGEILCRCRRMSDASPRFFAPAGSISFQHARKW